MTKSVRKCLKSFQNKVCILGQSQMTKNQGPYSSHFIFYVTYKWAQKSRVSHYTKLERFAIDKYYCLLGPFVSYVENEVIWIWLTGNVNKYWTFLKNLAETNTPAYFITPYVTKKKYFCTWQVLHHRLLLLRGSRVGVIKLFFFCLWLLRQIS